MSFPHGFAEHLSRTAALAGRGKGEAGLPGARSRATLAAVRRGRGKSSPLPLSHAVLSQTISLQGYVVGKLTPPSARRGQPGLHSRTMLAVAPRLPHWLHTNPKSENSMRARSPCLRMSASTGSIACRWHCVLVARRIQPGGVSRRLWSFGCRFGSLPPIA